MTMPTIQHADAALFHAHLKTGLPIHNHAIGQARALPTVRVHAGEVDGFGEAPPLPTFTGYTHDDTLATLRQSMPDLMGRTAHEALDWVNVPGRMADPQARAAIDIALHDVLAKIANVPLYRYLGAAESKRVRISRAIGLHTPERVTELASGYVARGVTSLKLKVGRGPVGDAAVMLRLRRTVGETVEIALDANEGYDVESALDLWKRVKDAAPAYFEQPLPRDDIAGSKRLRSEGVVVVADESAFDAACVARLARCDALDGVVIKLVKCGGLRPARAMAEEALGWNLPVLVVDPLGSAISLLAGLHLAATLPTMPFAHGLSAAFDVDAPHAPHTPVTNGHQAPPSLPGLGADVSWHSEDRPPT